MSKEVLDQANEFVKELELKQARQMFDDIKEAEHRANTCGCCNCQKALIGAQDRWTNEAWRIFDPDAYDEEEEWVREH